jgi:hypothetical protein
MTQNELQAKIDSLESKLMDAKIDCNMKDGRIAELEKQVCEYRFQIRELEIGTQTMHTLKLEEEEETFDPRESGVFHKDTWSNAR